MADSTPEEESAGQDVPEKDTADDNVLDEMLSKSLDEAYAEEPEEPQDDGTTSEEIEAQDEDTAQDAFGIARAIGDGLEHVGVFAVELFDLGEGGLVVNEIAPRVHNTGHWTMDACGCGQFEQHMRAVAGWPLGDPAPHSAAVMINLIGEDAENWSALSADPEARLHLYGKREIRAGRKMGHVTRLGTLDG